MDNSRNNTNSIDTSLTSVYTIMMEKLEGQTFCSLGDKLFHSDHLQGGAELTVEILNTWNQNPKAFLSRSVKGQEMSLAIMIIQSRAFRVVGTAQ